MHVLRRLGVEPPVEAFVGEFDVFHATNYAFPHRIRAAKRVVTIHDLTLLRFPEWHPQERVRNMARQLSTSVRCADHIVTDSQSTTQALLTLLDVDPRKVTAIPLAADACFRPLPRTEVEAALQRWRLKPGGYLLFLGTLEPRKNVARLLDAVEAAPGVGPLVVAGAERMEESRSQGTAGRP